MSSRVTFSDRCVDVFIEPYKQGAYNIRDAFTGTKTEMIGRDAISGARIINVTDLSLGERVSAFAIGSLLIVPIVNMVVLAILRNVENNFLYGYNKNLSTFQYPVFLPQNPPPAGNNPAQPNGPEQNPPPAGNNPAQPNAPEQNPPPAGNNPAQPNAPEHNPPQGGFNPNLPHINPPQGFVFGGVGAPNINQHQGQPNLDPPQENANAGQPNPHLVRQAMDLLANMFVDGRLAVDAEHMVERKTVALNRLGEIEGLIPADVDDGQKIQTLVDLFECHHNISEFDIDVVLARYETNENSTQLFTFLDWAAVDADTQQAFREAINRYAGENPHEEHYLIVNNLYKNLLAYFTQRRNEVVADSPEEERLKEQFQVVCTAISDANNNCIDQMLSQLQTVALDVIVEGEAGAGGISLQEQILNRARLALCKHKIKLIREILNEQNPNEAHMADLERMTIQTLGPELGLSGRIFAGGARFAFAIDNANAKIARARETFLEQYKPEEFLLTGLRAHNDASYLCTAFNTLSQWTYQYLDLESEENLSDRDPRLPHYIDHRISDDQNNRISAMAAGSFTIPATALMLETLGVIRPRA